MKSFRRYTTTVNSGSMADIAFLLLIFFLVTTTISADKGILRQLPRECPPHTNCIKDINERNVLRINLNAMQDIMVDTEIVKIDEVQNLVKRFVDNNGADNCKYCEGVQSSALSDHPKVAVISISHDALTKYALLVAVQDEITKAYYALRVNYANTVLHKTIHQLSQAEMETVRNAYPFIISEVMIETSI